MARRVVITGMGAVTPLGNGVEEFWQNLLDCQCNIGATTLFDSSTFPTQFSAEVKNYDFLEYLTDENRDEHKNVCRNTGFMIGAAVQAWRHAKLPMPLSDQQTEAKGDFPPIDRIGVYLGAGEGPVDFDNFIAPIVDGWQNQAGEMDWSKWAKTAFARMNKKREVGQEPNMPSSHIARIFKLRGPCMSCLTACAASTQAIGEATDLIRNNEVDIIISGGAHTMIHPLGVTGFNRLTALSTRNDNPKGSSRPFDAQRDGFVLAEGAGAIIIEELETARKRGATIRAEICGYGSTADAFRVTDQHESGRGGTAAVLLALKDAGMKINDIDYVSTHGTGTAENDSIETHIIKNVFGKLAYKVPLSSVKSMLGHLIAAAGVVELITCILAIRDNIVPPTINLENFDEACDLDYVPNQPRKIPVKVAMSNSFGFGGQNNTLIIREFTD